MSAPPTVQFFTATHPAPYITHITISRPSKLNAFHPPMWSELSSLFTHYSTDPDTRVILLSGAGDRAFTAGLDVTEASKDDSPLRSKQITDPARKATALRRHILELQDCVSSVARCEKPVIALLHGYVFGLGIDLATACDIRICSQDAKFCVKEVDIGLAADVGTLSRLPKICGLGSWVKDVCLTARVWGPEEAERNGFVSRVVKAGARGVGDGHMDGKSGGSGSGKDALIAEGVELAKLIASKSPVAVQGTKNILDQNAEGTVNENLRYTAVWNAGMLMSSDVERAMGSGLKKRVPTFEKL